MNEFEEQEIAKLYMEMYNKLYFYANAVLKNHAIAQECVQDTFRIACAKPEEFLGSENPQGWLMLTLKNVMKNTITSRKRLRNFLVKLTMLEQNEKDGRVDEVDVDVLYSDLTNRPDYQLIKMVALDQKSIAEIAEEYEISVDACAKRIQRAKISLQKKFENEK